MSLVLAVAASGGRAVPNRPALSYAGSGTTNMGKFNIDNYDPSLLYSVTSGSGTISGSVLTVTTATGSATITARLPRGLSASASIVAERKAPDQGYYVTVPFTCYNGGGCAPGPCGCGTFYAAGRWCAECGDGFWACCDVRVYYWNNYAPTYTWGGAAYTDGQGEWWKIT